MKSEYIQVPVLEKCVSDINGSEGKEIRLWINPATVAAGVSIITALAPKLFSKDKINEVKTSIAGNEKELTEFIKKEINNYTDKKKEGVKSDVSEMELKTADFDQSDLFSDDVSIVDSLLPLNTVLDSELYLMDNELVDSLVSQIPLLGAPLSLISPVTQLITKSINKLFSRSKKRKKQKKMKKLAQLRERQGFNEDPQVSKDINDLENEIIADDDREILPTGRIITSDRFDFDMDSYEYIGDIQFPVKADWWFSSPQNQKPGLGDYITLIEQPFGIESSKIQGWIKEAENKYPKVENTYAPLYYARSSAILRDIYLFIRNNRGKYNVGVTINRDWFGPTLPDKPPLDDFAMFLEGAARLPVDSVSMFVKKNNEDVTTLGDKDTLWYIRDIYVLRKAYDYIPSKDQVKKVLSKKEEAGTSRFQPMALIKGEQLLREKGIIYDSDDSEKSEVVEVMDDTFSDNVDRNLRQLNNDVGNFHKNIQSLSKKSDNHKNIFEIIITILGFLAPSNEQAKNTFNVSLIPMIREKLGVSIQPLTAPTQSLTASGRSTRRSRYRQKLV
jgi:hypothetical protein